ncbi:MAG: M1 family metallopeptidase [Clostridia bacterium]|nr:M1 family metallopeptidase [Clostridia bacterium]
MEDSSRAYSISATLAEDVGVLSCEMNLVYDYFGENSVSGLLFYNYANNFRDDNKGVEIKSVYCDGKQVGFSEKGEKGTLLEIPLVHELFFGDRVDVTINYELKLPVGMDILGMTDKEIRLSGWYPTLCPRYMDQWVEIESAPWGDSLFSDVSDYEVRLSVPKYMVVASSGKRVSTVESGERITYAYEIDNARDFALSISKDYKTLSGTVDGVLISAYGYEEEWAEQALNYAKRALSFFSDRYCSYPHSTYSVAQTELNAGGMEFSGLVYVSAKGEELEEVVAHETAHQWWYGVVGSNPTEYAWLDEGLAEYSTLEYIGESRGIVVREKIVDDTYRAYISVCQVEHSLSGRGDIPMTQKSKDFRSQYEYVTVTYLKGKLFYENLKEISGKSLFDKALKRYCTTFYMKTATPQDLKECFSEYCNINYSAVFTAWEEGRVVFCEQ